MNKVRKIQTTLIAFILTIGVTIGMLVSCDESMDRLLKDDYSDNSAQAQTGHILCIVMDGASGKAVNTAYTHQ